MGKNSDFDLDLQWGQEGEEWLKLLADERKLEVKRDRKWCDTGNVFFEVSYRGKPSGIMVTKSDYFAYILTRNNKQEAVFIWRTDLLKEALRMRKNFFIKGGDSGRSLGVLIPVKDLGKLIYP